MTPEEKARVEIDKLLKVCGWEVQDRKSVNLSASLGVAVREVSLETGESDYLLFVDRKAIGTVEAKPEGWTLRGVEPQSQKYVKGVPEGLPAWKKSLPFVYESTGVETHFTDLRDVYARSREVFAFHRPETLLDWIRDESTLRNRLKLLPPLITGDLWPPQVKAIQNLEKSFFANRPRALIQMATGSGKTFMAISSVYRLVKFGKAKRILFLVDRGNLGRQAYKEFQQYVTPDDGRKFTEIYNVQYLKSNKLDPVSKVCITTIQRLYSMLKGEEDLPTDLDEVSGFELEGAFFKEPLPVTYNPKIPIEMFDVIITDECHRSIYNLWRQVLEYFDAFLIGLTATPSKQTIGFFDQNLVMEYSHEQAVADGVNVNYDVYRIRTEITERGSEVDAGFYVDKRDRQTRKIRWEQLDEDMEYEANQLDRDVVAEDQIRTVIQTFRDKLFIEIFPGRTDVPKTLIYAKDDSHAEDIVKIVREEFGKGNEFCQKITYKTTGAKTEDLIASFRNSYNPRIAVTVDMIATGTDIKPLEIVFFMRSVRSRTFFEQMKGRGVRVISETDLQAVTPDVRNKTHFIIVDAVGVCERDKTDSHPLERKRTVSFENLLQAVAFGHRDNDSLSSLAGRLARLDQQLNDEDREEIRKLSGGQSLREITHAIVDALDPDVVGPVPSPGGDLGVVGRVPSRGEGSDAGSGDPAYSIIESAVAPIATNPQLRNRLIELHKSFEQTIDRISKDRIMEAHFDETATFAAKSTIDSFERFIAQNKDEITALQILYSQPHRRRLTFKDVKDLANAIEKPPQRWTTEVLWRAYETLDRSKVRGSGQRVLTDIVSLVQYAVSKQGTLMPFADTVKERFENWLLMQTGSGRQFTAEQIQWLELIRDHIASSIAIEPDDFELSPFNQKGGLGKAYQVFGSELPKVLEELNHALASWGPL
jgi:type I restriction enzyme R subunit